MTKIAVVGTGYVGMSMAVLLAQHNQVVALDINPQRVAQVNAKHSPFEDADIARFLAERPLNLKATLSPQEAYAGADWVIIATPTDYDAQTNRFDTSCVESVIQEVLAINPQTVMVIKSTAYMDLTHSNKAKSNQISIRV